ncbi:potassium-transporting ATPase subunit C [Gordonia sp. NPDC058843]|uniref:potassium-transporting ATPase subunit C n=1 Tax=Gordonia sp. NPDC058843 TaxID=3346648 RepID=UPI0036B9E83C
MNSVWSGFVRQCVAAAGMILGLTLILGVAYPAAVWAISRVNTAGAEGSQVSDAAGCPVGSTLIGVDPRVEPGTPDPYLHARVLGAAGEPMATGDPSASAASNQGPNSEVLLAGVTARRELIARREGVTPAQVPADAVTGSGSGLDPHITPAYAELQVARLARENGRTPAEVRGMIDDHTEGRQLGFLGQPRVNVLEVNLALGHAPPGCRAP